MKDKVIEFITRNGYVDITDKLGLEDNPLYQSFYKDGCYGIDVGKDEVVLLDETGDFAHIFYSNPYAHYAMLGMLIHYNCITIGYRWNF